MTTIKPGLCSALTPAIVATLKSCDIRTVTEFITEDLESLSQKSSISYKERDLLAIRRVLLAQHSAYPVLGSDAYTSACLSLALYSTGCENVDGILDGGLYTGEVTEIAGNIAAGKTQFCLSCASSVLASSKQNVLYLDTCGSFSVERLVEILQIYHKAQSVEDILTSLQCVQAFSVFDVFTVLEKIQSYLTKQTDAFYKGLKLLIVDSITSVIYPVLGGNQMDGHGLMVHLGHVLKRLASEFSLAVLICNNVTSSEDGQRVPSLGRTWSHVPHTRLVIERTARPENRNVTLIKSCRQTVGISTTFTIPS